VTADLDDLRGAGRQSLLIVEPSEVVRMGLSVMARSIPLVVSATGCDDLSVATRLVRTTDLTTMLLSDKFGGKQTEELREEAARRGIKCLVTMQEGDQLIDDDVLEMITHGVVLIDGLTTESFADILRRSAADQTTIPARLLQDILRVSRPKGGTSSWGLPVLTPREQQILSFMSNGLSNKQIARSIRISEHGVKRHVANILAKLNCPNRTLAVSYALQHGLLGDDGAVRPPAD
jgi:two-component system, NarL family, nitrate/nitrite response regulator NarL